MDLIIFKRDGFELILVKSEVDINGYITCNLKYISNGETAEYWLGINAPDSTAPEYLLTNLILNAILDNFLTEELIRGDING